jgi:hypothetical protein
VRRFTPDASLGSGAHPLIAENRLAELLELHQYVGGSVTGHRSRIASRFTGARQRAASAPAFTRRWKPLQSRAKPERLRTVIRMLPDSPRRSRSWQLPSALLSGTPWEPRLRSTPALWRLQQVQTDACCACPDSVLRHGHIPRLYDMGYAFATRPET